MTAADTEPTTSVAPFTASPLWRPALITFISSACTMVLELAPVARGEKAE
jgi:hypothetical protein